MFYEKTCISEQSVGYNSKHGSCETSDYFSYSQHCELTSIWNIV